MTQCARGGVHPLAVNAASMPEAAIFPLVTNLREVSLTVMLLYALQNRTEDDDAPHPALTYGGEHDLARVYAIADRQASIAPQIHPRLGKTEKERHTSYDIDCEGIASLP